MKSYNFKVGVFKEASNRPGHGSVDKNNKSDVEKDLRKNSRFIKAIESRLETFIPIDGVVIFFIKYNKIPPKTKRINFKEIKKIEDIPQIGSHIDSDGEFKVYYKLTTEEFSVFKERVGLLNSREEFTIKMLEFFLLLKEITNIGIDNISSPEFLGVYRVLPIKKFIDEILKEEIFIKFESVSNVITLTPEQFKIISKRFPGLIYQALTLSEFSVPEIDFEIPDETISISGLAVATVGVIDSHNGLTGDFKKYISLNKDVRTGSGQDLNHGSMVGSLIIANDELNTTSKDGLGNFNIKHFEALSPGIGFYELGELLKQIVPLNSDVKVWNLSLGGIKKPYSRSVSPIGMVLDKISKENGVLFVVAAGNDRNTGRAKHENLSLNAPADSLNAISVGSVKTEDEVVSRSDYSSFGPVLHYEKPEVSHFGGPSNFDGSALAAMGDSSLILGEGGTSFSAPRVSRMAAYLIANGYSPEQAKAKILLSATRETKTKRSSSFGYLDGTIDEFDVKIDISLVNKKPVFVPLELPNGLEAVSIAVSHLIEPFGNLGEEYSMDNVEASVAWAEKSVAEDDREKNSRIVTEKNGESKKGFLTEGILRFASGKYFNSHTVDYSMSTINKGRKKAEKELKSENLGLYIRLKKLNLFDLSIPLKIGLVVQLKGTESALSKFIEVNNNIVEVETHVSVEENV